MEEFWVLATGPETERLNQNYEIVKIKVFYWIHLYKDPVW